MKKHFEKLCLNDYLPGEAIQDSLLLPKWNLGGTEAWGENAETCACPGT